MNDQALHGIALYNPDLLSRDELNKYFVARKPLLNRLVKDLHREGVAETPQHSLIIGARGMGKSTLLRRFFYAIEDDETLSKRWLPLCFPEEQYNIASLSDLWLNCLDALGDTLEQLGDAEQAHALDELSAALPSDEEKRAVQALHLLKEQARKRNKRLILLIDNLDIVLERLKGEHWAVREVLSEKGGMVLMGTSAHAIEATYEYDAAFYDFFKIEELKGLNEEGMRSVLLNLAEISNNTDVKTILEKDKARIKTLHTLTGGNPRTTVLLYGVISQGMDGNVRSDLEKLLDQCTPLYKARFEELSIQNQKIVDKLAVHWDPIRAGDLAVLLRLQVNAVSSQLNRLVQQGIVEKVKYPGKKAGFQVAERFFNIWYLMRASRRVRRRLIWLVHFLRMFYTSVELSSHARGHLDKNMPQDSSQRLRYAEYGFALAQALEEKNLCRALESASLHTLLDDNKLRCKFPKLVDLEGEDAPLRTKAERIQILNQAKEALLDDSIDWGDIDKHKFIERLLGTPSLSAGTKLSIAKESRNVDRSFAEDTYQQLNMLFETFKKFFVSKRLIQSIYRAIADGEMESLVDLDGAKVAAQRFDNPAFPVLVAVWDIVDESVQENVVLLQYALNEVLDISDEMKPFLAKASLVLASRYMQLNDTGKAVEALNKAVEYNPEYSTAWAVLGKTLANKLNRPKDGKQALIKALKLSPDTTIYLCHLALIELEHFNKQEAEKILAKATNKAREARDFSGVAILLNKIKRPKDALQYIKKALEIEQENTDYLTVLASIHSGLNHENQERETLARIIQINPSDKLAHNMLARKALIDRQWIIAEDHFKVVVEHFDISDWDRVLLFVKNCIVEGFIQELLALLQRLNLDESWRPLVEAVKTVKAIESGSDEYLLTVAPEVRKPALELYERLSDGLENHANV